MTQAWQLLRDAGNARMFFAQVRRAVRDMDEWRLIAEEGAEVLSTGGSGSAPSDVSDPTANRAIWLADNDDAIRADARRQLRRCEDMVGAGLVVIAYIRRGLGAKYADALECHYIDGLSLRVIAEDGGITKSAAQQRIAVACDWCDSQPLTGMVKF